MLQYNWSAKNFKKNALPQWVVNKSPRYSHVTGQGIPYFDNRQLHNMADV